jgi:hypothetical protein
MTPQRQCGGCTLCCKLLPVHEGKIVDGVDNPFSFHKNAGERCQYQSHAKGCTVYGKATMPRACRVWNCRWLVNDDTGNLSRPDRSHYVIDIMPDYVTMKDDETGKVDKVEVVQIWCDPNYANAHRDPALRAYLLRRAEEGIIGLVRYSSADAFAIIPPTMAADKQWHEHGGKVEAEHSFADKVRALR